MTRDRRSGTLERLRVALLSSSWIWFKLGLQQPLGSTLGAGFYLANNEVDEEYEVKSDGANEGTNEEAAPHSGTSNLTRTDRRYDNYYRMLVIYRGTK